ncbi:MAG: type VI secretion system Vgr family protein [Planctomycetaceae bacterium]
MATLQGRMNTRVENQDNLALAITTPLGPNALILHALSGSEQLSGLFHFDLELASTKETIDPTAIVGKSVTCEFHGIDTTRFFHGIINHLSAGIVRNEQRLYRASLVPKMWLLTQTRNSRVFQNKSAPDIVQAVLKENAIGDVKMQISGKHPKLEYCVQYQESDFAFLSRLMELHGIFYFFEHAKGKHTLTISDANTSFKPNFHAKVPIAGTSVRHDRKNRIRGWEHGYAFRPGSWSQTDYNFEDNPAKKAKSPAEALLTTTDSTLKLPNASKFKKFNHGAAYVDKKAGANYTKTLMEAEEAAFHTTTGYSDCTGFSPGSTFAIEDHPVKAENGKKYLLTSIKVDVVAGATEGPTYRNTFMCIPAATQFRPPRVTPKPRVHGSQTAVVVGPPGEEVWPDKYGRVKVQFFWDREGVRDENSSCWVRCAQGAAGKGWGAMSIPRVGQEVVVTYLEGDPDRPLITGVVYNGDQLPAYELPKNKTRTYFKTNSSPKGEGFNELRFEDLADKEHIFLHAQKDMIERVLNDRHLVVGQEKDGKPIGNQHEKVFGNVEGQVLGNTVEKVEGNSTLTVGKGKNKDGGNLTLLVEKNRTAKIEANDDATVMGDQSSQVDGTQSLTVGKDLNQKVGGAASLETTKDLGIKSGANAGIDASQDIVFKAGTNVVIDAGASLTLKVGGNFVVIDASGVSVKGAMVNLNSGGAAGSGSPPAPQKPNAPVDAAPAEPTAPFEDAAKSGSASAPDSLT